MQRLDAEEIRDAMLASSNDLEVKMGGPSAKSDQHRRTIDTRIIRNSPDALLDTFDAPDGNAHLLLAATRPPQHRRLCSWSTANGRWRGRRHLQAGSSTSSPRSTSYQDRVVLAFRLAFGRSPRARRDCGGHRVPAASKQGRLERAPHRTDVAADHTALVDFCHVLFNSNEFLYVD